MDINDNNGIMGAAHIQTINNGGDFWTDIYKSTAIRALELNFKPELIRTHGISDFISVPAKDGDSPKVLLKWYKRHKPLTDEELKKMYE